MKTCGNIAVRTGYAGKPAEALKRFRALLPDQERVLGIDCPNTMVTRGDIAKLEQIVAAVSSPSGGARRPRNSPESCGSGLRFKHCKGMAG